MVIRVLLALAVAAAGVGAAWYVFRSPLASPVSQVSSDGVASAALESQAIAAAESQENLKKQAIEMLQRFPANRLDAALPEMPFAEWLALLLPSQAQVQWEVNDCGEQSGDAAVDEAHSLPACVTASAEIGKERLDISSAFATWKSGVIADIGGPEVFFISFGQEEDFLEIAKLSSLPSFRDAPQAPAEAALYRMRWIRKLLSLQRPDAGAWWQMQKAGDALAHALPTLPRDKCYDPNLSDPRPGCPGVELAREAKRLGIGLEYCWPGETWLVGNEGYAKYLELWPTGPRADETFWRTHIEPPCCDECGLELRDQPSRQQLLQACKEFIEKFPHSHLRGKAEEMVGAIGELKENPQGQDDLLLAAPGLMAIHASMSRRSLTTAYGKENVADKPVYVGEGESVAGTVLFPDDPERHIEILWKDAQQSAPSSVRVTGEKSHWRLAHGISLGASLRELEQINGGSFTLAGFGWDYSGTAISWNEGRLKLFEGRVTLRLAPEPEKKDAVSPEEYGAVTGDRDFSSAHPVMQKLNPRVYQVVIQFD
ncbi:MAG: hypothetical protein L0Z53_11000 [Acidobacteriales bacterium]|nr:hypothetical protein [Terriglobales bacterium]